MAFGMAMGQACMLLASGTRGKRYMLPHTTGTFMASFLMFRKYIWTLVLLTDSPMCCSHAAAAARACNWSEAGHRNTNQVAGSACAEAGPVENPEQAHGPYNPEIRQGKEVAEGQSALGLCFGSELKHITMQDWQRPLYMQPKDAIEYGIAGEGVYCTIGPDLHFIQLWCYLET